MDTSLRFLLVEDREEDAILMARELTKAFPGCETTRVQSQPELSRALIDFAPDVVLSDHSLPHFNAWDALRLVYRDRPHTPVIIVTGSIDEETAAEYIQAGAADYVVKQRLHRLGPAVQRALVLKDALHHAANAEDARERSEHRFRRLVEYSSDIILLVDADGRILYASQSLRTTLGYWPAEMASHSIGDLLHLQDRPQVERMVAEVSGESGRVARSDVRAVHRDGTSRHLEVVTANRLDDLAVGAIVVTFHDITERTEAEEALRQATDHLRAVIEASPLAIFSLNTDGTVRTWNTAAERTFGWAAYEVVGRPLALVSADLAVGDGDFFGRVLRGEVLSGIEVNCRHRAGRSVRVRASASPLFDATDHVTGIMALMADITDLKQLEDQYRQVQKMEAVGRLASGVAHDFNNILTAISGYCQLVLRGLPADHNARADLGEIGKAVDHAGSLTRQLLAFSRQQVLAPVVVDLNDLVANMEKMLDRLLGDEIEMRVVPKTDASTVRADPGQLEQVVLNLVVNARDAMPAGGEVTIETALIDSECSPHEPIPTPTPGRYVVLTVTDGGTGMDEHTRTHLFEPFFTTKEAGLGSGLGLATVYGIVQQSGGHIAVESSLGRGTTFTVYLPAVAAEAY